MCTSSSRMAGHDEEYTLPCVEALFAGTLALMTGVAQAAPGGAQVGPMAAKIVDNLAALAESTALSAPMRALLARLLSHWWPVAHPALADAPATPALWMPCPGAVQ
ncbi:hypothetical protein [Ottowia testudinis]|uniref:Uncharacterized protein n=1 Tax=Ottowia testudinis TaxID=2816950 RepID=A0A975CJY5_9BURK|nr:hypothetical protein [Ottowia testudinis]QTD46989.1 hypothetical protein J1M35_09045 [Ottowia testudinis]